MDRTPPDEVFAKLMDGLPAGAYLTAAVGIVTYAVPGEEAEEDRGPFLALLSDGTAGRWVHLGMAETAANDMRADLRMHEGDDA